MVIDADAHANEPRDLFDRYLEKDFRDSGPKVVEIDKVALLDGGRQTFSSSRGKLWAWDPQRLPFPKRQTRYGDQRPGTR